MDSLTNLSAMDTDVIARFYPLDSEETIRKIQESIHCEAVPPLYNLPTPGASAMSRQHALVLRFSRPPRGDRGFVFGHDTRCDCVLPAFHGMSRMHFAITYDASHRLVLEDFSTAGTTVTYSGQPGERRTNFTWIIGEDEFVLDKRILVTVGSVTFEVVVPEYSAPTSAYNESRALFAARRAALGALPGTTRPFLVRT